MPPASVARSIGTFGRVGGEFVRMGMGPSLSLGLQHRRFDVVNVSITAMPDGNLPRRPLCPWTAPGHQTLGLNDFRLFSTIIQRSPDA